MLKCIVLHCSGTGTHRKESSYKYVEQRRGGKTDFSILRVGAKQNQITMRDTFLPQFRLHFVLSLEPLMITINSKLMDSEL